MSQRDKVIGILLAGGQARRMGGGDKCLRPLDGRPLLQHVVDRIGPQVDYLVLNANGDPDRFADFGLPVAPDVIADLPGPLAGVLTGMRWAARNRPAAKWIVSVPTDAPFLPFDLVRRMRAALDEAGAELACAASGGRAHPVVGLWPVDLAEDLETAMRDEGIRKVDLWTARYRMAVVEWSVSAVDPFFNANRPEDLEAAAELLRAGGG